MAGQYFEYPFAETLSYGCAILFKLPYGARHLKEFDKNSIIYCTPIRRERENSGRCKLLGGETYVIVASPELAGTLGDVYLSIYLSLSLQEIEIKRVFHPLDKNEGKDEVLPTFIPEDLEKTESTRVPTWKLELVRESLKYIINEECGTQQAEDSM